MQFSVQVQLQKIWWLKSSESVQIHFHAHRVIGGYRHHSHPCVHVVASLEPGRVKAKIILCMNNKKQLGVGANMYLLQNNREGPGPMTHWTIFYSAGQGTIRESLMEICSGVPEEVLVCPRSNPRWQPQGSDVNVGDAPVAYTQYADNFHVQPGSSNYLHTSNSTLLFFLYSATYATPHPWADQPGGLAPRELPFDSESAMAVDHPGKTWSDDPADYLTGPILWGDSHVTLPTRTAERWAGPVPY